MPTEEVFTSPHRLRTEGVVRSTMPLVVNGQIVRDLTMRFEGGRVEESKPHFWYNPPTRTLTFVPRCTQAGKMYEATGGLAAARVGSSNASNSESRRMNDPVRGSVQKRRDCEPPYLTGIRAESREKFRAQEAYLQEFTAIPRQAARLAAFPS